MRTPSIRPLPILALLLLLVCSVTSAPTISADDPATALATIDALEKYVGDAVNKGTFKNITRTDDPDGSTIFKVYIEKQEQTFKIARFKSAKESGHQRRSAADPWAECHHLFGCVPKDYPSDSPVPFSHLHLSTTRIHSRRPITAAPSASQDGTATSIHHSSTPGVWDIEYEHCKFGVCPPKPAASIPRHIPRRARVTAQPTTHISLTENQYNSLLSSCDDPLCSDPSRATVSWIFASPASLPSSLSNPSLSHPLPEVQMAEAQMTEAKEANKANKAAHQPPVLGPGDPTPTSIAPDSETWRLCGPLDEADAVCVRPKQWTDTTVVRTETHTAELSTSMREGRMITVLVAPTEVVVGGGTGPGWG
ncbi:Hypothetical protein D9617_4g003840 [Elsinoe fawcettii]|nr:Hypothetical protein D9617_4g003840 [Elsinoe fawcettii]